MKTMKFDGNRLTIDDIEQIAKRNCSIELDKTPEYQRKIDRGAEFLDEVLEKQGDVYGVTTGYGDSCSKTVSDKHYYDLPIHLTRFHGCGMGELFDDETTRAILAVRLQSLSLGYSGVSYKLLQGLENLIHNDVLPRIPQEGSVGASGDLTPLSYVGAVLIGERDVLYKEEVRPSADVLKELGVDPHILRPKEGLAIMNGTAAMTAVACLAYKRAEYLAGLATKITSMASLALKGNAYHFDKKLFDVKPHPGQAQVAARIRQDLDRHSETGILPERIQDPYSIRCAPHVIGVFYDSADMLKQMIENELNSANDNPIIDPESKSIFHGGHFYGGHIAFAMDSLKNIIANISDLLDRQLAVLVDEKFNRGLAPNLSGAEGQYSFNHGFKAVQIAVSAWTAEALKNTMPASVFSRSTECHNQDKVSMGTIAARDCIRVLELSEQVGAACLLAVVQAVNLRLRDNDLQDVGVLPVKNILDQTSEYFEFLVEDRPLDKDLRKTVDLIRSNHWDLAYEN
ncbi:MULTISPECIES: histidine ammonia-lyase [unclassified Oceanispirochaeta]|uniref:HAL/PAL/TAL family ammonia-lyase n=1 Tax=unclassified Oceanispirochaeta TaxID=2635722 RepID=UPI000E08F2EC|nr:MULTISPECIES: aromatic amino acid ammonia-lyase [unclassified Oceanispirochaeta]MBF9015480.1 aromatic amino acid lyase [Oceanispirochaeta sp. M2]NPD71939.1 aromatic amino acid lyase [Oceanispirochaeta sp. M1]RDG32746.1 aromatic amino acid lyase [Oceanispirochaeta sp. M1]